MQALARSRTTRRSEGRGLRMAGDGPSVLEEQPVSADEAIALIDKAKTIVEADMGVKVCGLRHVTLTAGQRGGYYQDVSLYGSIIRHDVGDWLRTTRRCRVAW